MNNLNDKFISNTEQFERMRLVELKNGRANGAQILELENANSLRIEVVVDRALDIVGASWQGKNLVWLSPTGIVSNQNLDTTEIPWLRNWAGGLITTGGLDHALGPDSDETSFNYSLLKNRDFPIHGRISYQPADRFQYFELNESKDSLFVVKGLIKQVTVFGEYLVLNRTIFFGRDNNLISIFDEVTNQSSEVTDHMFLYHCNFGWPLIQPGVTINKIHSDNTLEELSRISQPVSDTPEQVLVDPIKSDEEFTHISIQNTILDFEVHHIFKNQNLNYHLQWLVSRPDFMVFGSEASTNDLAGRKSARSRSELKRLKQAESVAYQTHFYIDRVGGSPPTQIKDLVRNRALVWDRIKEQS